MPRIRINHPLDCACCAAPVPAAQSLEELDFTRSACHFASQGDLARVKALIERHPEHLHSDGKDGSSGYTPLHYAARSGHVKVVEYLIIAGSNVNATTTAGAATPLHRAAFAGHIDIVEVLLKAGARPDLQDADGETAAHKAVLQNHIGVANMLLKLNPSLKSIEDKRGRTVESLMLGIGR